MRWYGKGDKREVDYWRKLIAGEEVQEGVR